MALIYVAMFLSTSVVRHDGDRLMSTHKQQGITAFQAQKRDCVLTSRADGNKDCTRACEGQTRHPRGIIYINIMTKLLKRREKLISALPIFPMPAPQKAHGEEAFIFTPSS